jgi:hypothetical protein
MFQLSTLILCRKKSQEMTSKVTFIVNEKLSGLETPRVAVKGQRSEAHKHKDSHHQLTFRAYFDPFKGPDQRI